MKEIAAELHIVDKKLVKNQMLCYKHEKLIKICLPRMAALMILNIVTTLP